MPSKSVTVGSSVGLHARPAALIAEAAGALGSAVTINGVDAGSSLMIMTLGAKCGDTVEVAGAGDRDEAGLALPVRHRDGAEVGDGPAGCERPGQEGRHAPGTGEVLGERLVVGGRRTPQRGDDAVVEAAEESLAASG